MVVGTAMLHICRPAGAKNLVVVRFIARSFLVNGTQMCAPRTQFAPTEEQQLGSGVGIRRSLLQEGRSAIRYQAVRKGGRMLGNPTDVALLGLRRGGHRIIPFLKVYIALTAPDAHRLTVYATRRHKLKVVAPLQFQSEMVFFYTDIARLGKLKSAMLINALLSA